MSAQRRYRRLITAAAGFTLMELMMVVVIIGLISAISVPNFRGYMLVQKVNSASRDMVTNLRFARLRSVNEMNPWVVMFLISSDQYLIFADDGGGGGLAISPDFVEDNRGNLRPDPGERVIGPFSLPGEVTFGMVTASDLPNGITVSSPVSFGGSPPTIVFYPNGSARETGVIMLHLKERILEANPDGQRAIILYKPTGFARSFRYNPPGNPTWK